MACMLQIMVMVEDVEAGMGGVLLERTQNTRGANMMVTRERAEYRAAGRGLMAHRMGTVTTAMLVREEEEEAGEEAMADSH